METRQVLADRVGSGAARIDQNSYRKQVGAIYGGT